MGKVNGETELDTGINWYGFPRHSESENVEDYCQPSVDAILRTMRAHLNFSDGTWMIIFGRRLEVDLRGIAHYMWDSDRSVVIIRHNAFGEYGWGMIPSNLPEFTIEDYFNKSEYVKPADLDCWLINSESALRIKKREFDG
jgi:hypothetical protein